MREFKFILSVLSILSIGTVFGADSIKEIQFTMPKIESSELGWGRHVVPIKISSNSAYLKYVTVESSVKCQGGLLNPERLTNKNYAIFPGDTVSSEINMVVPGNYGLFNYEVKIYDVVDTMDNLLESQVIERQGGTFTVAMPLEIAPYVKSGITVPPMVGRHIDFDNNFSRVLPFLISEGKSVDEIAKLAGCNVSFVNEELDYMTSRRYYKKDGSHYFTAIAPISEKEASEGKEMALKVAESLASKLAENMKSYKTVLDSLVKAGFLTADSNSFMDGGSILYKPFPVVTVLSLWYDMGSSFITAGAPLYLFDGTDLCNAYIPDYMYLVAGNPSNNGKQYFSFMRNFRSYQFYFGDTIPLIYCPDGFMLGPERGGNVVWEYDRRSYPEGFIVDTALVRPMLNHLRKGVDPILKSAFDKLGALGEKHKKNILLFGQRYWFWNMVTTRTVEILENNGAISRRGNGQYRLDGMSVK